MIPKTKTWIILTTLFMLFLAGCQPTSSPPAGEIPAATATIQASSTPDLLPTTSPTATQPVHLQVEPDELNGLEITFAVPWSGEVEQTAAGLVSEFNRTNIWGIKVSLNALGSDALLNDYVEENLKTDQSANVIVAPIDQLLLWQANENGVIALDDYIANPQWGIPDEEIETYYPSIWEQDAGRERQLGIPALRTSPVLIYNTTWAKELGFSSPPVTTKEFEEQVCAAALAVRLEQNDGTGGWIVNNSPLTILNWLNAFGGVDLDELNAETYRFNTSPSRQALTYLRTLFDEGCAWNSRNPSPYDYFSNRQALIYSGTLADIPAQAAAQFRNESADEWTAIPYPTNTLEPSYFVYGNSYAILVDGPQRQLASWLFIRWMSDPERQARLASASATLPLTSGAAELMTEDAAIHPQWKEVISQLASAQPAPHTPSWAIVRNILADAAWQTFQPNAEIDKIPGYLQQLDATIHEILGR